MRSSGSHWERQAETYLQRQGLELLTRNFNCRLGEIDLVMLHGATLVFVEVRYRGPGSRGSGAQSVTRTKQVRVSRAAGIFLTRNPAMAQRPCRFDVISIEGRQAGPAGLDWIRNAFTSTLS